MDSIELTQDPQVNERRLSDLASYLGRYFREIYKEKEEEKELKGKMFEARQISCGGDFVSAEILLDREKLGTVLISTIGGTNVRSAIIESIKGKVKKLIEK